VLAEVVSEMPLAGIPRGSDEVVFDLSRLGEDATKALALRGARPGDRFSPFGMEGSVRLFRWLAGLGVARSSRPEVPVVTCKESIIWVVGRRRGDQAIVTGESRDLLRLRVVG
jgi:tRNA(Ile)-lysidine synthase